jgi:hypothetical protein
MSSTFAIKHLQSAGKQKPESLAGGPKAVLANNHGEQVGISATETKTDEEVLEVNPYF